MDEIFTARVLIYLWIAGLAGAGGVLFFFGKRAAKLSNWGYEQGWENEIAIWNLSMILVLIGVLIGDTGNESYVIPGLVVMSLSFSINHSIAMYRSKSIRPTHLHATIANVGGVFLGLLYYLFRK
jgi:hypothetical protein